MPVYARAAAGQSLPSAYAYQSQLNGGRSRYSYNTGTAVHAIRTHGGAMPVGQRSQWLGHSQRRLYRRHARPSPIPAASPPPPTWISGPSRGCRATATRPRTIQLQCPLGTTWRVGLNNGANAIGNTRRMAGPRRAVSSLTSCTATAAAASAGAVPWAPTPAAAPAPTPRQSLTVYGRVPAQPTPVPGSFSDTVIVTLTY